MTAHREGRFMTSRTRAVLIAVLLVWACTQPVAAQDYPARPINFIVPYVAGGGTDLLARLIAKGLERRLGKPLVIDNRPGAGTVIAATAAARAAPDGYTLFMATSTPMAINVSMHKNLPYDPTTDLVPVGLVAQVPFYLVVNPTLPIHSVADLVKLAKDKPGTLSIASSGAGSAPHLYAELLKSTLGIEMTHVPYKGGAQSVQDVIAGHVSMVFSEWTTARPLIQTGKVRALGVSTVKRVAAAPDVPSLAEAGVAGYDAAAWQMVVAPARTPAVIVNRLNAELRTIVNEADIRQELLGRGMDAITSPPPDELARFVKSEIVRWSKVVQRAGIAGSQ
jgi:tripartite-type tricarboxylate transporter receptor subunit TctC